MTKLWIVETASASSPKLAVACASSPKLAVAPIRVDIRLVPGCSYLRGAEAQLEGSDRLKPVTAVRSALRLIEEAAAFQELRALLGGDLDVARGEQEDLVGDALHPAVECVRQAAGEVDQALGELLVGALEVEDHRDAVLEPVGDLLGVVEAAREDEVDLDVRARRGLQAPRTGRGGLLTCGTGRRRRGDLDLAGGSVGVGPVVVVASAAARQPADIRAVVVRPLELLVRGVAVLVPVVVLLGDAEVDEGAAPEVGEAHVGRNGNAPCGRTLVRPS